MGRDVIIACDFSNKRETFDFLDLFSDYGDRADKPFLKIGMELFYAEGPEIVREIKTRGHRIFLDLKCHDIPNTVRKTMRVLAELGVDICNVHAAGSKKMMRAAIEGLSEGAAGEVRPLLIAVTQLTSTDEETMRSELLIDRPIDDVVSHYGLLAKNAGLDGVVCSPHEAPKIHDICGGDFITVTPGIRLDKQPDGDDQKRIMTPEDADNAGADYIVVGRPITEAENPVMTYEECVKSFISE